MGHHRAFSPLTRQGRPRLSQDGFPNTAPGNSSLLNCFLTTVRGFLSAEHFLRASDLSWD